MPASYGCKYDFLTCESRGRMVTPAWPPITGTETASGASPMASATKVFARSTSSFVTPSSLRGSYVPALCSVRRTSLASYSVSAGLHTAL